jgi:magnesium chelatase subunit D
MPLLIVLTDGAGNVAISHLQPPQDEAYQIADQIAGEKVHCVVINMEHAAFDQGLAAALAEHLKSPCYSISDLKAENLYLTVRKEMSQINAPNPMDGLRK